MKKLGLKNIDQRLEEDKHLLTNQSLQQSNVFKAFGFRTIQTTMCLTCRYSSRRMEFNTSLSVPLKSDEIEEHLTAEQLSRFTDPDNQMTID